MADVTAVFAHVALILADVLVVLVDVTEVLNGFTDAAVGEVLDELLGVLPTVPAILTQVLLILVLLNYIANEATGVLEHAGMAEGGDGEGRKNREHKTLVFMVVTPLGRRRIPLAQRPCPPPRASL